MKVKSISCHVDLAVLTFLSKLGLSVAENPGKTGRSVINCRTRRPVSIHNLKVYCSDVKGFDILMFP